MPLLKCQHCGKEVKIPKYREGSFKYCSKSCKAKAALTKIISVCEYCGREFEHIFCRANKAKYCCKECYYKAMHLKGSVEVTCKYCNKKFLTSPSHKRVFCCKKCKSMYELQSGPENTVNARKWFERRGLLLRCEECGYDSHPEILGVHHKDHNHHNNSLENLIVLCPICHSLKHKKHIVHGGL